MMSVDFQLNKILHKFILYNGETVFNITDFTQIFFLYIEKPFGVKIKYRKIGNELH